MNKIEILSPAGGSDSVIAAVRSGADAVYIGAKQFSARAAAHNFDESEMRECVRFCHERDVKVYLALNTLIFDDEMDDALETAKAAARADIDALIMQDIGLAMLIREAIPDLPLHASTQLSAHTPRGVKALYEMGFKRVVVSRELSFEEIRAIREFCPEVELEVFVHGALCMCVSGQCYFSAMLGGRSANRGMCAQPCRLPMRSGDNDHALSLKDNGSLNWLCKLEEIGVASAKIEGRMKRPEYVAAATAAAKEARDRGEVSEKTQEKLRAVFSRTGFTDGYLRGEIGEKMFGYRRRDDVVTADTKLFKELRASYKDETRRAPVELSLTVRAGERMTLTADDGERQVTVNSADVAEKAVNLPLSADRAEQSLRKTGNTPYRAERITVDTDGIAAVSAASLNALRRAALEELSELRARRHQYTINEFDNNDTLIEQTAERGIDWACVKNMDFPEELGKKRLVFVALDGMPEVHSYTGTRIGVEAPRVMFGNEQEVYEKLRRLKERGVTDLLAHNIASAAIGRELGYTLHAGFGMNLANSRSLYWAKQYGFVDAEISVELELRRIEKLRKCIPVGVIGYGYFPLMICRNTPSGKLDPCKTEWFLQDRKNEKFRIVPSDNYIEIMNCVPVLMPQKDYGEREPIFHIIRLSVENSVDNMEKILENIRENHGFERFTHGLYHRGVK